MSAYYNEQMIAYLITNLINGRRYVGITTKGIHRRWTNHKAAAVSGSSNALHRAIRKYGVENFSIEVVASALSVSGLLEVERELIAQHETRSPRGYNMTDGGDGTPGLTHSAAGKAKISASGRGRVCAEATRSKLRDARKGKPLTVAHRTKLAEAKIGRGMPPRSDLHKARISEGLRRAHARRREAAR